MPYKTQRKYASHREKARELLFLVREREEEKDAERSYSSCFFESVPWTFSSAKSLVIIVTVSPSSWAFWTTSQLPRATRLKVGRRGRAPMAVADHFARRSCCHLTVGTSLRRPWTLSHRGPSSRRCHLSPFPCPPPDLRQLPPLPSPDSPPELHHPAPSPPHLHQSGQYRTSTPSTTTGRQWLPP